MGLFWPAGPRIPVTRFSARSVRHRALHLGSRTDLVRGQDRLCAVLFPVGACDLPAVPLRSADAARLEGVPAVFAVLVGADGRRIGHRGMAPGPLIGEAEDQI